MKDQTKHRGFLKYDSECIDRLPNLSLSEQIAYQVVCNATAQFGGYDKPLADMAYWLRASEQTARRTLHTLVNAGLIEEIITKGKATTYRTRPLTNCNPLQIVTPYKMEAHPLQIVTPIIIDNIDILESNKKAQPKKENENEFIEPEYKAVFQEWLDYKKERKESYKSERSLKACYNRIKELSGNDPNTAQEIVQQSIANNWAGLFALKNKTQYGNNNHRQAATTAANSTEAKPYSRIQQLGDTKFNLE